MACNDNMDLGTTPTCRNMTIRQVNPCVWAGHPVLEQSGRRPLTRDIKAITVMHQQGAALTDHPT